MKSLNLSRLVGAVWPLLLLASTLVVLAAAVYIFGQKQNPSEALFSLWRGAFGSVDALSSTAVRATILVFFALGIVLSFRAGIFNIGAEGQSRVGALTAAGLAATASGPHIATLGVFGMAAILICGAAAGALWSLLAGLLRRYRGAPDVISTLMLNFIALSLGLYLLSTKTFLRESRGIISQSDTIPEVLRFQTWGATQFHTGVLLAIPALLICHVYLFHTPGGMAVRAVGLSPSAAKACGIPLAAVELRTFAIAGALAGFAGAMGVLVRYRLDKTPYPAADYGFMAIAVALVADLRPLWVLPTAMLFAGLEVGSASMERNAGVSREVVYLIEGLIILAVLVRHIFRSGATFHSRAAVSS